MPRWPRWRMTTKRIIGLEVCDATKWAFSCGAIILAAGQGRRFQGLKQDVVFKGKPLWRHPFDLVTKWLPNKNVIVVGKDVEGGRTRSGSVQKGLAALPSQLKRVIILEAARPLVADSQILQLLKATSPSITMVKPLVNTVIGRDGTYYNRADMYELLVPQAFDFEKLTKAYQSGRFPDMTDETRVMWEFYGIKPAFVEAGENLFKVTYPSDISILESIFQKLQHE